MFFDKRLLCFNKCVLFYFTIIGKLTAILFHYRNLIRNQKANLKFSQIAEQVIGNTHSHSNTDTSRIDIINN